VQVTTSHPVVGRIRFSQPLKGGIFAINQQSPTAKILLRQKFKNVARGNGLPRNPSAADHQIVLIKHRRLAGRDGALRQVQFHLRAPVTLRRHRRRCAGMVVTNLGCDFDWLRQMVERNPVAAVHGEFIAVERRVGADNDTVVRSIQFDDVNRLGRGDAQALPLADGVKFDAIVMTEDAPCKSTISPRCF